MGACRYPSRNHMNHSALDHDCDRSSKENRNTQDSSSSHTDHDSHQHSDGLCDVGVALDHQIFGQKEG